MAKISQDRFQQAIDRSASAAQEFGKAEALLCLEWLLKQEFEISLDEQMRKNVSLILNQSQQKQALEKRQILKSKAAQTALALEERMKDL